MSPLASAVLSSFPLLQESEMGQEGRWRLGPFIQSYLSPGVFKWLQECSALKEEGFENLNKQPDCPISRQVKK